MNEKINSKEVKALLVFQDKEVQALTRAILESAIGSQLRVIESNLVDAIEFLESHIGGMDLVFFEIQTTSRTLVKALFEVGGDTNFIVSSSDENLIQQFNDNGFKANTYLNHEVSKQLLPILNKLATSLRIPDFRLNDGDQYVSFDSTSILGGVPLRHDIYIKVGQGHFVRLFKKGDGLEKADLKRYQDKQPGDLFFVHKEDCAEMMKAQAEAAEKLAAQPHVKTAEVAAKYSESIELVRDVVSQIGFTPEAQMIARSSVSMAMKVIGGHPKLAKILNDLKRKEGDYISSHSFLLGQVACALAHQVEWSSATTFFKLSLAAFLHDIALSDSRLAKVKSYDGAKKSGTFTNEELQAIRIHPSKGSEYSKQFSEIPSDIDLIIFQHHERPDGTGFPRELTGKMISPLSALFIIAHDFVDYILLDPKRTIQDFLKENKRAYQIGQFKKIYAALVGVEE